MESYYQDHMPYDMPLGRGARRRRTLKPRKVRSERAKPSGASELRERSERNERAEHFFAPTPNVVVAAVVAGKHRKSAAQGPPNPRKKPLRGAGGGG